MPSRITVLNVRRRTMLSPWTPHWERPASKAPKAVWNVSDRGKFVESHTERDDAMEWWHFELGQNSGREAAFQHENQRLTLQNLARREE